MSPLHKSPTDFKTHVKDLFQYYLMFFALLILFEDHGWSVKKMKLLCIWVFILELYRLF